MDMIDSKWTDEKQGTPFQCAEPKVFFWRTGYRSPCGPKRFRVLADAAPKREADTVFVCAGLPKRTRGADWRLVAVWSKAGLSAFAADRNATKELRLARLAISDRRVAISYQPNTDAMLDRVKAAKVEHLRAAADVRATIACVCDPKLGLAMVPSDCTEVDFVSSRGDVLTD